MAPKRRRAMVNLDIELHRPGSGGGRDGGAALLDHHGNAGRGLYRMNEPPDRWVTASRIERMSLRDTVNLLGCGCLVLVVSGVIFFVLVVLVQAWNLALEVG